MMPEAPKYFSESQRRSFDNGVAEGVAKAKADGIAKILAHRGLQVTEEQRRRISECTDLVALDRWFDEAFLVTSVDELLG
jgi:hypothetical protein